MIKLADLLRTPVDGLLSRLQEAKREKMREAAPIAEPSSHGVHDDVDPATGHAPGHRHLGPPPEVPGPRGPVPAQPRRHQAWMGTSGRVDRARRNERHGDEKQD